MIQLRTQRKLRRIAVHILLSVLGIANIYPILWTASTSFKSGGNVSHSNLNPIPDWVGPKIVEQIVTQDKVILAFSEVLSRRFANDKRYFEIRSQEGATPRVLSATYYDLTSTQGLRMPVALVGFNEIEAPDLKVLIEANRMEVVEDKRSSVGLAEALSIAKNARANYLLWKEDATGALVNVLTGQAEGSFNAGAPPPEILKILKKRMIPHMVVLKTTPLKTDVSYEIHAPEVQDISGNPAFGKFSNYVTAWLEARFARYFLNSVVTTGATVFLVLLITSMAGYALGRKPFPGRKIILGGIVGLMFIPAGYTIIPIFHLVDLLHLTNTIFAIILVLVAGNMVLNTILISGFFSTLPKEMEESALMDGSSFFQTYFYVMLPLAKPILATVALFTFIQAWNNFFVPLVFSGGNPGIRTVAVALYHFVNTGMHSTQWELISTGAMISLLPILVIFLFLQRYFIEGVAGAIKG